jgi:hypothetical protein
MHLKQNQGHRQLEAASSCETWIEESRSLRHSMSGLCEWPAITSLMPGSNATGTSAMSCIIVGVNLIYGDK